MYYLLLLFVLLCFLSYDYIYLKHNARLFEKIYVYYFIWKMIPRKGKSLLVWTGIFKFLMKLFLIIMWMLICLTENSLV